MEEVKCSHERKIKRHKELVDSGSIQCKSAGKVQLSHPMCPYIKSQLKSHRIYSGFMCRYCEEILPCGTSEIDHDKVCMMDEY